MRRKLTTIGIVLLIIGFVVALYFIFFASSASVTVAPTGSVSFPTSGQIPSSGTEEPEDLPGQTGAPTIISARLVKISKGPVVPGQAVLNVKTSLATSTTASTTSNGSDVAVNYIERQSGNVFTYLVGAGSITRTNNQTVPGIQSASWISDASFAFVRYLSGDDFSTINTYALPKSGSDGFFLPQNLADIAVSSTNLLTLASGVNGSVASLERLDGTRASQVFTTPLSSLRVSFAGKSQYLAYTKPSAALYGDAFIVNGAGHFFRIAGPLNGLVALSSKSGKWTLVSYTSDNNSMQMELVNTTTGDTVSLPVATIADKCVWTADDSAVYCGVPVDPPSDYAYPDDWYQGVAHFSDRIWKIDVLGRYAQLVLDFPSETDSSLDVESLAVDPMNTELVFTNKNDGSLWGFSL